MPNFDDVETVEVEGVIKHQTGLALLLDMGEDVGEPVWIPFSQIVEQDTDPHTDLTTLIIPEWLAEEKGLI